MKRFVSVIIAAALLVSVVPTIDSNLTGGVVYADELGDEELGEDPETPGEDPEIPGEDPETPGEDPETPGEDPEEPSEDPETPGEDPETPGEDPETPGEDPETPGEDPETPGEDPETPGKDPETPGEDPEEPSEDPNEPPVNLRELGVEGFVTRLYSVALGRQPDSKGFDDWCTMLKTGDISGGEAAYGFVFSSEFQNRNYKDELFVTYLYELFFNREPDEKGLESWLDNLENGMSREEVLQGFVDSNEWANLCAAYGIISGGDGEVTIIPPVTDAIKTFVTSLYSDCLDRTPDEAGLEGWCNQLTAMRNSGKEVAFGFFFSTEFMEKSAKLTDRELVTIYYKVFLNRLPDKDGMDAWVKVLENGGGVDDLFRGFADSKEFKEKCMSYGIICGAHMVVPNVPRGEQNNTTTWVAQMVEEGFDLNSTTVRCNIINQCNYWYDLQESGSNKRATYVFGAKSLEHGGRVDCSGFVTAIIKRAVGTQGDIGDATYQHDTAYSAEWNDRTDSLPSRSGDYVLTSSRDQVHTYIDKYGIASTYGMDTRSWEQYLTRCGVDSYKWSVRSVDHDNFGYDLDNDGFCPGDIVIWSYANGTTDHIGIYAGNGMVYHILSKGVLYTNITEIRTADGDTISYATIYRMT